MNITLHQLAPILNIGSKRKHLHTFQAGEIETDSPRKIFKQILNFWGNTTQPELIIMIIMVLEKV
jgi:hypothetical protein